MEEITTLDQMDHLILSKGTSILFKYSPTCGISQVAQEAWESFSNQENQLRLAQCDVLEARPAARGVVERIGVAHQSPQVLAILDGKCVGHASHYSITVDQLKKMKELLQSSHKIAENQ